MRGGIGASQQMQMGHIDGVPSTYASDDEEDENYLQDNFNSMLNEKDMERKYKAQNVIDDQKIAVVYEALSKGVELENNKLYYTMLEEYPYFQKILRERKQAMNQMKKMSQMQTNM